MEDKTSLTKSPSPNKSSGIYIHPRKRSSGAFSIIQTIESDFSKRKRLKQPRNKWNLPQPQDLFKSDVWHNKHMMRGKEELNNVKNSLSNYNMKDWHQHTRNTNHAGDVVSIVRKKIGPELLTQAWCKFYEIVSSYHLVPEESIESNVFNSLHLCEAPGAFITSLNHFLKLRHPTLKWEWKASTLNPYYEGNKLSFMINDDRFILHTLDSWDFGQDQTGDMFQQHNVESLISMAKLIQPVHLVTGDGSIDCQSDPGEQESIVSPLHYYETLIALNTLSPGGSFLLKIFTLFECQTICLLYLLSCLFQTVDLFKPATSKEGNSEVYVICLNFSGFQTVQPYLNTFSENFNKSNDKAMFSEDQIPMEFLCEISRCSDYFKSLQLSVLERNIESYTNEQTNEDKSNLFQLRRRLAYSYIERYRLEVLPQHYIVGNDAIRNTPALNLDSRSEEWTFADKKCQDVLSREEILLALKTQLDSAKYNWPQESCVIWFQSKQLHKLPELNVKPVFGNAVETVYSSKFCLGSLLHLWNKLYEVQPTNIHTAIHSNYNAQEVSKTINELKDEKYTVCDMRDTEYEGNVHKFELLCLSRLVSLLKTEVDQGSHLVVVGLPLLTRVSVGIVYSLSSAFEKTGLLNPTDCGYVAVFLNKSYYTNILEILEHLLKTTSIENQHQCLQSIVPVTLLVKDIDWYKCVLATNQIHIKNVASTLINRLLSESRIET